MLRWIAGAVLTCLCASAGAQQLSEAFDNVAGLPGAGWVLVNNSTAGGTTTWFQGNSGVFASQAGGPTSYLAANFLAAPVTGGNISLWAISPTLTNLRNGVTVTFYTRTETGSPAPDRLELRMSLNGSSSNVGTTDTSVGDFTASLVAINPSQAAGGYPEGWQQYTATLSGLPAGANTGRIAFRYFITDTTTNGNYIGVDTLVVSSGAPDLTVAKTHTGNFTQGQTGAAYTITVSNVGSDVTSGLVSLVDTLPSGLTATTLGGTGWSCTLGTLTCTRSDALAAGGAYPPITLLVNVASNAPASVVNTATVSGGGDTNPANNSASDTTTIIALTPDLAITKSHTGSFTQGQTGATYTITVNNAGTGATVGIVNVVDTLPASLTATAMGGSGWSCTLATLTCTRSDALAAGASYPSITLTVSVAATAPASVVNTATVSGGGDVNTGNNTANDTTVIAAATADLSIVKSHVGPFTRGQVGATYTIAVSNVGVGATAGVVTVTDTLPAGLTATAIAGSGWSCTLGTLTCTRSDVLAASASYPAITLTVNVASSAPANVVNVATVSGGGDTTPSNGTASDPTAIVAAPIENLVPVPTLGEWALVLLAAMLALLGAQGLRRRH